MMETDRELLELAALAANQERSIGGDLWSNARGRIWNPLDDDGDALRLAVKLQLSVKHFPFIEDSGDTYGGFLEIWRADDPDPIVVDHLKTERDRLADTRRAIVRAAAEIGKHSAPSGGKEQS